MSHDGFGNLHPDAEHRIECDHRLLENHGDLAAAHLAQAGLVQPCHVVAGYANASFKVRCAAATGATGLAM